MGTYGKKCRFCKPFNIQFVKFTESHQHGCSVVILQNYFLMQVPYFQRIAYKIHFLQKVFSVWHKK